MAEMDVDAGTKAIAFTTNNYRCLYPAIDPTRPDLSQKGKVIVITGASQGLGRLSFATSFAQAGAAAIILIGRSADGLIETERIVNEINPDVQVFRFALDVTDETAVNAAFKSIVAQVGIPHVLINNAANFPPLLSTVESDLDSWWLCQEVNIKGTFLMTRAFLKETGPTPSHPTTIMTLTSQASIGTGPGMGSYSMSKMALTKLMSYVASEHPTITAVSLDPGILPTEMARKVPYLADVLLDKPEVVGGLSVWVSSGDKNYLSGRWLTSNWDVEEIERRKDEIVQKDLFKYRIYADFATNPVVHY
ncbi:hypothetical protein N7493_002494 [Penicillium malachiteum]|uniref:NAD(P)-binding protein n=1 Tax=Penicillium malachiteum TaxID=1324776 RepID=A0AAD6MYN0_9EURO|nr:hypothetical protein N7493_002494 [Penicillium malachiteum]